MVPAPGRLELLPVASFPGEMGNDTVPWIPGDAELEVFVPDVRRDFSLYFGGRVVLGKALGVHRTVDPRALLIAVEPVVAQRRNHVVLAAMLRQRRLDAGPCRLQGFDENVLVGVRDDHFAASSLMTCSLSPSTLVSSCNWPSGQRISNRSARA